MVRVEIRGADQLYELNKKLKAADKKLATKLRKAIRTGAKPAVTATKAAVKTIPVTGSPGQGSAERTRYAYARSKVKDREKKQARAQRGSGLRSTIASAIKLEIKTGKTTAAVRIVVDGSKLPPGQRTLPAHLDSKKGWRHPVFGNREVWVAQRGKPWFETTIRKHLKTVQKSILAAMDELAKEIEK